jgi:D-glycero-D-manno-heptose 1,7-bisphosphate phosphatase
MHKALFLDRDGVINKDVRYPYKPEHIVFMEGIFDLCRTAVDKGYLIVVVTNQAGVAKGYFTEQDVVSLHAWMGERFKEQGVPIAGFYFCPYHKDALVEQYRVDSPLRKPRPGMILQAVKELDIDVTSSLMVGDKPSDRIELPGLRCVILKSGYSGDDGEIESLEQVERFL